MKTYVVFIIIVFLDEFKIIWNKKKKKIITQVIGKIAYLIPTSYIYS